MTGEEVMQEVDEGLFTKIHTNTSSAVTVTNPRVEAHVLARSRGSLVPLADRHEHTYSAGEQRACRPNATVRHRAVRTGAPLRSTRLAVAPPPPPRPPPSPPPPSAVIPSTRRARPYSPHIPTLVHAVPCATLRFSLVR